MLYNCLSWYKFVNTHLYHSRQLYNIQVCYRRLVTQFCIHSHLVLDYLVTTAHIQCTTKPSDAGQIALRKCSIQTVPRQVEKRTCRKGGAENERPEKYQLTLATTVTAAAGADRRMCHQLLMACRQPPAAILHSSQKRQPTLK